MISLLLSGISFFAAQEEFPLELEDLKKCLTDGNVQITMNQFDMMSQESRQQAGQFYCEHPEAKSYMLGVRTAVQKDITDTDDEKIFSSMLRFRFLQNHVTFLFSKMSLAKKNNSQNSQVNSSFNIFEKLGAFVTQCNFDKHAVSIEKFHNECLRIEKYDSNNEENQNCIKKHVENLNNKMNEDLEKYTGLNDYIPVLLRVLAFQYQNTFDAYKEHQNLLHEVAQKKDFEKRAIVNGKRVATGLGIFTAFVAMTAWLWSWQA